MRINRYLFSAPAILAGCILLAGIIYGSYWVAKTASYVWWYEDMVQETVREMVKPEALRDYYAPAPDPEVPTSVLYDD